MKFNHYADMRSILILFAFFLFAGFGWAQSPYSLRSGSTAQGVAGLSSGIPCSGSQIFFEDFENGLPANWIIIDGDTLTPRMETGLSKGWQTRADYNDTTNTAMVSCAWYTQAGRSDDWLITPQISLGNNSCLSWTARSQDASFPEYYEVRISTTTPDTSAFMSDTALVTISGEGGLNNIRSLNLAAYANQDVYLAFRHTSEDKFVLLLDDVKVSNVNTLDIGVMDVTYGSPAPGDTVTFGLTVANYGSDTVTSFKVSWAIDGGAIKAMLVDSIKLAPNATLTFDHSSLYFSDTLDRFYDLCLWTGLPNNGTDQDINNDTLCIKLPIGSPVGAPEPVLVSASMRIFPNPFSENFSIEISGIHQQINAEIRLYDLFGKEIWVKNQFIQGNTRLEVAPGQLAAGIYLLELRSQGQHLLTRRVIHQ